MTNLGLVALLVDIVSETVDVIKDGKITLNNLMVETEKGSRKDFDL